MKRIFTILLAIASATTLQAQEKTSDYTVFKNNVQLDETNINKIAIPINETTHFISPEPIEYVDISTKDITGDMPEKNIFRIKADTSKVHPGETALITIVTKSYVSVYRVYFLDNDNGAHVVTINPNDAVQTNQYDALSKRQCFSLSLKALHEKRHIHNIKTRAYGMDMWINNIYTFGDYILVDLEIKNNSKIQFDIDQLRFKVVDKHLVKATVSQDIEFTPIYSLYQPEGTVIGGKRTLRNLFIFKKFTFPTQKLFSIELNEKQYSGRRVQLGMEYNQLLQSETLN